MNSLTIRPKIKNGESLTSYLYQITDKNKCKVVDIAKLSKLTSISKRESIYTFPGLDFNILNNYDINKLSGLLKKDKEKILSMTSYYYHQKFGEAKNLLNREFEKNHRKYCPVCLKEGKGFKLIWQVNEIEICLEHQISLQSQCISCGSFIQYANAEAILHNKCKKCGASLSYDVNYKKFDDNYFKEEIRKYEDWQFLLSNMTKPPVVDGYNIKDSLVLSFLYLLHVKGNPKLPIPHYRDFKNRLLRFELTKKNRTLSPYNLLKSLRHMGISLNDFSRIKVPNEFINKISYRNEEDDSPVCLAPWCSSYHSSNSMVNVKLIRPKKNLKNHQVCSDCMVVYAQNNNKEWVDVTNIVSLYKSLENFFSSNNANAIENITNISKYKINYILGYYLNNNGKEFTKNYGINDDELNYLEKFKSLFLNSLLIPRIKNIARREWGWNELEFFYYFQKREVQEYLHFELKSDINKRRTPKYNFWREKVNHFLNAAIKSEEVITHSLVAQGVGCSPKLLKNLDLTNIINLAKEKQKENRLLEREKLIEDKVIEYIKKCEIEDSELTLEDLYKEAGLTAVTIKKMHPNVYMLMNEEVLRLKQERKEKLIEEYKIKCKLVIKQLLLEGSPLKYTEIMRRAGLKEEYSRTIGELRRFIDKEIDNLRPSEK